MDYMEVKKVWIEEGCIACGACESECPEVFKMDELANVIEGVSYADFTDGIKSAADSCPVEVIKYSE
ncbi:MAG: ferredoxin [Bacteroidetes bacterium]|nr:ferredoxin [Bacteroidota bacterium]